MFRSKNSIQQVLFTILLLTLICPTDSTAKIIKDVRAVHIQNNAAQNAQIQWGVEEPSDDFIAFLNKINANWVGIQIALHLDGSMDSTVERLYTDDPNESFTMKTWTDEALSIMVNKLHDNGFKVLWALSLDQVDSPSHPVHRGMMGNSTVADWDPETLPENWPWAVDHPQHKTFVAEFWQTYTEQALYFAKLAESLGVEMYALGTETDYLFRTRSSGLSYPNHFYPELKNMVDSVRAVYSGLLTYDMEYSALAEPEYFTGSAFIWEDLDLDVVGVSAYFRLADTLPTDLITKNEFLDKWDSIYKTKLSTLQQMNPERSIVFLELGYTDHIESPYKSISGAYEPWTFQDSNGNGVHDGQDVQANIYSALFETNKKYDNLVTGFFLWGHDWTSDKVWEEQMEELISFAVRNKSAETVVAEYYDYVKTDSASGSLSVNASAFNIIKGETGTAVLKGGSSPYTAVSNDPSVAACTLDSNLVFIQGISPGNTSIVINDSSSNQLTVPVTIDKKMDSCISVGSDLSIPFDCLSYMGNSFSLELDYNLFIGAWMMDPFSVGIASVPYNCIPIDTSYGNPIVEIPCVQLAGQGVGFNLYYDSYLGTWAIQPGTLFQK